MVLCTSRAPTSSADIATRRRPSSHFATRSTGRADSFQAARRGGPAGCAAGHPIFEIIENIGRYIAMTMPPTTMPRKRIMTGSMSFIIPATAMSTSSS